MTKSSDMNQAPDLATLVVDWQASHGRRVLMGEAGCQVAAPSRADRLKWYQTVGIAQMQLEQGLSIWDDMGSWKIYDRVARTWDVEVLHALGLKA